VEQIDYGNMGLGMGMSLDEDVLLGENEVLTPRQKDQLEKSLKTGGASTPSRDGADTPNTEKFIEHQQQLGGNKGFIHDLTAANFTKKYPLDRSKNIPANSDSRNLQMHPSNNTYPNMPSGEPIDTSPQFNSQNSFEERKNNEEEGMNDRDNNYWEREQEHQNLRDSNSRWDGQHTE